MTAATQTLAAPRAAARPAQRVEAAPANDDAWPFNLKLLLGVLVVFAANIATVLYLANQMPH